jgi:hypothetical protein
MALIKIPNVSVPGGGDVYSLSINQGYTESPSTIDLSILNGEGAAIGLSSMQTIQVGDLLFNGYCFSKETEQKVGEKVVHLKFCDGSVLLDQIQVGLVQRHYGVGNQKEISVTGKFRCPNCEGSLDTVYSSIKKKVRVGNIKVDSVYIMGNEEPQHSQCDFPDVNYTFSDLITLMRSDMSITFLGGAQENGQYRNKFVGSLREVLSNWCAEFGYSFYWDFVKNTLIIYNLSNGINIGTVYETIKNLPEIYVKSYKEKRDLSSTISHGVAVMKQMPDETYQSQPVRNFIGIYYSHFPVSCGGDINAGAISKTFGTSARKVYLIQNGLWGRAGFFNLRSVVYSTKPSDPGPCNEKYGIPTVCDALKGNYYFYVGDYSENAASQYEELDVCEAENYGKYFKGPFVQAGRWVFRGNLNNAINGEASVGACKDGKKESVENKVEPSPSFLTTPKGVIKGISISQEWQSFNFQAADIFAYKIEGQSIATFGENDSGLTLFGIPKDYFKSSNTFRVGLEPGTTNNHLGEIIQDVSVTENPTEDTCGDCQNSSKNAESKTCGDLKCDPGLWVRKIGWFDGFPRYIYVKVGNGGARGPTIGNYVGFIEQSASHTTSADKTEKYNLYPPPNSRNVMNTDLTLVDANNDNSMDLPYVPPAYSDVNGRQENVIEFVGTLPVSLQAELNPTNGVESYQINYSSEGMRTIITFGTKGRKFPKAAGVLSETISSRGNYTIPKLAISQL